MCKMDSKEDILAALEEFSHKNGDKVPPLLERYLNRIAATGETLFAWPKLRPLFLHKLDTVMREFFEKVPTDDLPNCPNVENVKFEEIRQRLVMAINEFNGAPFTIQRLCELITNPQKHYKRTDKFMRGIEKNLLVVSTVDPYGNKIVNETSKVMINGLDANGYETDKISPDTPDRSFFPPPVPNSSPSTNGNGSAHAGGDAGTSTAQPVSSWFASSSATDTVCPWGGGAAPGLVDSSSGEGIPCSSKTAAPTTTTAAAASTTTSAQLGPTEASTNPTETPLAATAVPKDPELSESSSESSGSSSSEQSTTPPLGDIDKDSEDSNESAKTSESSSSDSSLNEAEAEQAQPQDTLPPPPPEEASVEMTPVVEAVTTSNQEAATTKESKTQEESQERSKRSIEQDHTETLSKRARIEEDMSESSEAESSSAQPAETTEKTSTEQVTAAADSQDSDKPVLEEDTSQREAQPAEVKEGRDSQDSLGFDTPVGSDSEAAPTEDSTDQSKSEEPATSSTPDSDSAAAAPAESTSKPQTDNEPDHKEEVVAGEVPCEVSASDQTVENTPEAPTPSDAPVSDMVTESSAQEPAEEAPTSVVSSGTCQEDGEPKESIAQETPEPESTSQSEDSTQISQSQDVCQSSSSSLQTESSMDVN